MHHIMYLHCVRDGRHHSGNHQQQQPDAGQSYNEHVHEYSYVIV